MTIVGAIVASTALASVLYALMILAQFGRKLGAVTKMRPLYKGYYITIGLVGLALITHFLRASVFWAPLQTIPAVLNSPVFYLFFHSLPLASGLTLALGITWYYWSWLLKERW
jgi:hypothetical protein